MNGYPIREGAGLEVYRLDDWAPAPGIRRLNLNQNRAHFCSQARGHWNCIRSLPLVMLNGIWSRIPELRAEIQQAASIVHVIVADAEAVESHAINALCGNKEFRVRFIHVSELDSDRLGIEFLHKPPNKSHEYKSWLTFKRLKQ